MFTFEQPMISELAMLFPSPMYASLRLSSLPFTSQIVNRSERICSGWETSVMPLMTGMSLYEANSCVCASVSARSTTAERP